MGAYRKHFTWTVGIIEKFKITRDTVHTSSSNSLFYCDLELRWSNTRATVRHPNVPVKASDRPNGSYFCRWSRQIQNMLDVSNRRAGSLRILTQRTCLFATTLRSMFGISSIKKVNQKRLNAFFCLQTGWRRAAVSRKSIPLNYKARKKPGKMQMKLHQTSSWSNMDWQYNRQTQSLYFFDLNRPFSSKCKISVSYYSNVGFLWNLVRFLIVGIVWYLWYKMDLIPNVCNV